MKSIQAVFGLVGLLLCVYLTACSTSTFIEEVDISGSGRPADSGTSEAQKSFCKCDLDMSALEWRAANPPYSDLSFMTPSGYEIFDWSCANMQASSQGEQVDVAFACQPHGTASYPIDGSFATALQQSHFFIRRTFANIKDLSCCNTVSFQVRMESATEFACNCSKTARNEDAGDAGRVEDSGDAGDVYLPSCCFGTGIRNLALRVSLCQDTSIPTYGIFNDTICWGSDFPAVALGDPFDWTTLAAPISGFQLPYPQYTPSDRMIDLTWIRAVQVDVLLIVESDPVALCEIAHPQNCTYRDSYYGAHVSGGLSFRSFRALR